MNVHEAFEGLAEAAVVNTLKISDIVKIAKTVLIFFIFFSLICKTLPCLYELFQNAMSMAYDCKFENTYALPRVV
jgi:hypothetical protein